MKTIYKFIFIVFICISVSCGNVVDGTGVMVYVLDNTEKSVEDVGVNDIKKAFSKSLELFNKNYPSKYHLVDIVQLNWECDANLDHLDSIIHYIKEIDQGNEKCLPIVILPSEYIFGFTGLTYRHKEIVFLSIDILNLIRNNEPIDYFVVHELLHLYYLPDVKYGHYILNNSINYKDEINYDLKPGHFEIFKIAANWMKEYEKLSYDLTFDSLPYDYALSTINIILENKDNLIPLSIYYYDIGVYYLNNREYDKSIHYFNKALIELESAETEDIPHGFTIDKNKLFTALASCYIVHENYEKVVELLTDEPSNLLNCQMLGLSLSAIGESMASIKYFEYVNEVKPKDSSDYIIYVVELAKAYLSQVSLSKWEGNYLEKAKELLLMSIEKHSEHPDTNKLLGAIYLQEKKLEKAIYYLDKAETLGADISKPIQVADGNIVLKKQDQ